jgi:N-succinyldiaminopimelate aminotransferase
MNPVFAGLPTTIFETMSRLAREHDAVNLGQGFPDHPGPERVRRKAAEAVVEGWNQYPPMMGLPDLRAAVAAHYGATQGLPLDPAAEIMVTSGATEALAGALLALLEPGDEVILFQPLYDAYAPLVRRAGGVPRYVRLEPPDWRIHREALEAVWTPRCRAILINDPLNPAATVMSEAERTMLAAFCIERDLIAIADEVWEEIVFDGRTFRSLMAMPGMRERTVKIGSAGKMFSMTGWKVGFVCASPGLMQGLAKAHQFLTFTTPPSLQAAVAFGLDEEGAFLAGQRERLRASRDRFASALSRLGFTVLPSAGTYFLNVEAPPGENDEAFCLRLVREIGVAAIPVSAFYQEQPIRSIIRFCFAKTDETLDAAIDRLAKV